MPSPASLLGRYGPTALVTGAASGIGRAFAESLANSGFGLVVVDRDEPGLATLAEGLRAAHSGIALRAMALDLVDPARVAEVTALARTSEVGLVVHAAAIQRMGRFLDIPLDVQLAAVDLHCRTTLALVHAFARPMVERGRGGLVLFSSNSAILRTPLVANYAATKAYALTLAEALWEELRHEGVDVLGLVPGMTDTPGLRAFHPSAQSKRFTIAPADVVEGALAHLGKGPIHLTSTADRLAAGLFARVLPRTWSLPLARRSIERFFPHLRTERVR